MYQGNVYIFTDVFLSADFLEDVDLLQRSLSDLLNLLWGHLVWGGDVYDLHGVLLRCPFVNAAPHHTAHTPEKQKNTYHLHFCHFIYFLFTCLCLESWTQKTLWCDPARSIFSFIFLLYSTLICAILMVMVSFRVVISTYSHTICFMSQNNRLREADWAMWTTLSAEHNVHVL